MSARSAIVLLNWNGWRDTLECLESLRSLNHPSFAVIVIDNASTDGSTEIIAKWCFENASRQSGLRPVRELAQARISGTHAPLQHREVVLVQAESNGGFAAGNNLGLRLALAAGCERMWLLNNDTIVDPAALSALEQRMAQETNLGMVGSVLHYFDQPGIIQAVGGVRFNFWRARGEQLGQGLRADSPEIAQLARAEITYVAGASMLVSRDFLEDVGLMEEGYFLYFEEIDWACRAGRRWRAGTADGSHVYHKEGGSIGTASRSRRSELSQYYLNRNMVRFYRLHRPFLLIAALVASTHEFLKLLLRGELSLAFCTLLALADGLSGHSGMRTKWR